MSEQLELPLSGLPRGWCGRCRQQVDAVRSLLDGHLSPAFHWVEGARGNLHVCGGDDFQLTPPPDTSWRAIEAQFGHLWRRAS